MRQLKFHERKLLKKVDFLQWKSEHGQREVRPRRRSSCRFCPRSGRRLLLSCKKIKINPEQVAVMRRYHLQGRDDYKKYNKLCGMITKLVTFFSFSLHYKL